MDIIISAAIGDIQRLAGDGHTLRLAADLDLSVDLVGLQIDPVHLPLDLIASVNRSRIRAYVSI